VLPRWKRASIQLRLSSQASGRGASGAFGGRRATGGKRQTWGGAFRISSARPPWNWE
jgi:hypothetical protein